MLTSTQAKGAASIWRFTIGKTAKDAVTAFVAAYVEKLERIEKAKAADKGPGAKVQKVGTKPIRKFIKGLLSKPDRPFLWLKLQVSDVPSVTEKSGYVVVSYLFFSLVRFSQ